jgi:hypothetical protein
LTVFDKFVMRVSVCLSTGAIGVGVAVETSAIIATSGALTGSGVTYGFSAALTTSSLGFAS